MSQQFHLISSQQTPFTPLIASPLIATGRNKITMDQPAPEQNSGSTFYNPLTLPLYDLWVLSISNTLAWRCSTTSVLLPFFHSTLGKHHLDVGVGSGYYPVHGLAGSPCTHLTLADLNPLSLETSRRRILASHPKVTVTTLVADASQPFPALEEKFDSISLFYLLHCMPGPPEAKTRVFTNMARVLKDDGVLSGCTILGREAEMNWFARALMWLWNSRGVFDNWEDSRTVFEGGLRREFREVEVWVVGRILMFTARKPRRDVN